MDPMALREELFAWVRRLRPDRVVTMDPWARDEVHRDHLMVGQMASKAAAFACFHLLYLDQIEGGLQPHNASEVWYMGLLGKRPNRLVSIADPLTAKVESLLKFQATMEILDQLFAEKSAGLNLEERANQWILRSARDLGQAVGLKAAEAFIVQKCAPGHFDHMSELPAEMSGKAAAEANIIE